MTPQYAVGDRVRCQQSYGTITALARPRYGRQEYEVAWDHGPNIGTWPENILRPGMEPFDWRDRENLVGDMGRTLNFLALAMHADGTP